MNFFDVASAMFAEHRRHDGVDVRVYFRVGLALGVSGGVPRGGASGWRGAPIGPG